LRYIIRNGEKVLQEMIGVTEVIWEDVPTVEGE
jgi:hypothetical protein